MTTATPKPRAGEHTSEIAVEDGVNARMRELAQSLEKLAAGRRYEPDHEILMSLLERYENSHSEIDDLAKAISADNDGYWGGGSPEDSIGHIASYIGKIEAAQDNLQVRNFALKTQLKDIEDELSGIDPIDLTTAEKNILARLKR